MRHRQSLLKTEVLPWKIPWISPPPQLEVFMDASQSGWGFHASNGLQKQGVWSNPLLGCHINIKEMVVIWIALRSLRLGRGASIRVHSDKNVVVCCLNRGGSARSIPLWSWTLSIVNLLETRGWFLTVVHLKGASNVLADALSRDRPIATEWELDMESF